MLSSPLHNVLYLTFQDYQESELGGTDNYSFEEWKVKREEFKKGTRNSFISAFQVFEKEIRM